MDAKHEVAKKLALAHYLVEEGLIGVYRLLSPVETEAEPIKLLEVNRNTIPTGIMPLWFGAVPVHGIPYLSVIIEVTPDEFELIRSHQLALPEDWRIAEAIPNDNPVCGSQNAERIRVAPHE